MKFLPRNFRNASLFTGGVRSARRRFHKGESLQPAALLTQARRQEVPAQTHLYREGDSCAGIAFLLAGEIRVYKCGESGREITLY